MRFTIEVEPQEVVSLVLEAVKAFTANTKTIDVPKVPEVVPEVIAVKVETPKAAPVAPKETAAKSTPQPKPSNNTPASKKKIGRPVGQANMPTMADQIRQLLEKQPLPSHVISDALVKAGRSRESVYPLLKKMRDEFFIETRTKENSIEKFNYLLTAEERQERITSARELKEEAEEEKVATAEV